MRQLRTKDGTPLQQSMTTDSRHKNTLNMDRMILGIILDVHMSDAGNNIAAQRFSNQRSAFHMATVFIVEDGTGSPGILKNVVIPPDAPSAVGDYREHLPKGTTTTLSGAQLTAGLHNIDPASLDGEWCVVGFIGKNINSPYIQRWWPHPSNVFDPATSGAGDKKFSGVGSTLVQDKRFFTRINGVEFVVTKKGDLYLSTTYAGSSIVPKGKSTNGRYSRSKAPTGGSIRTWVKPSEVLEFVWTEQEDGLGIQEKADPQLPQTNPRQRAYTKYNSQFREGLYLNFSKERAYFEVPKNFDLLSREKETHAVVEEYSVTVSDNIKYMADVNKDITVLQSATVLKLLKDLAKIITTGGIELTGTTKARLEALVGPLELEGKLSATLNSTGPTTVSSATKVAVEAPLVEVKAATTNVTSVLNVIGATNITGNLAIAGGLSIAAPPGVPVEMTAEDIQLGAEGSTKKTVVTKDFYDDWKTKMAAVTSTAAGVGTLPGTSTAVTAIITFLQTMTTALEDSLSSDTKVS